MQHWIHSPSYPWILKFPCCISNGDEAVYWNIFNKVVPNDEKYIFLFIMNPFASYGFIQCWKEYQQERNNLGFCLAIIYFTVLPHFLYQKMWLYLEIETLRRWLMLNELWVGYDWCLLREECSCMGHRKTPQASKLVSTLISHMKACERCRHISKFAFRFLKWSILGRVQQIRAGGIWRRNEVWKGIPALQKVHIKLWKQETDMKTTDKKF